jgi:hypothetical protein
MRRVGFGAIAVCVLLAVLGAQSVFAQEPGPIARVYFVDVKSGENAAFEKAFKEHIEWRKLNNDPWIWDVMQVVNGNYLGDYVIRSGNHHWADFDAYEEFATKGASAFNQAVGPYINGVRGIITRVDLENIQWTIGDDAINYLQIVDYHIKMDGQFQFQGVIKKIHEAIVKTSWPVNYAWEMTENGGKGAVSTLVLPYENWAAMKGPEKELPAVVAEVFGEVEAQKIFEAFSGSVKTVESHVIRLRRDLSTPR